MSEIRAALEELVSAGNVDPDRLAADMFNQPSAEPKVTR